MVNKKSKKEKKLDMILMDQLAIVILVWLATLLMVTFCRAETMPIDNVHELTGWFFEQRAGYQHQALDIPANRYTPIKAVTSGKVITADWDDEYGNYVDIKDETGFYRYAHCQNYRCQPGDVIFEGQVFANVGNTGKQKNSNRPLGSHLHLERRENGKRIYFTDRFVKDGKRVYWSLRH